MNSNTTLASTCWREEKNRVKQSRTEQSRAEKNRATQSKTKKRQSKQNKNIPNTPLLPAGVEGELCAVPGHVEQSAGGTGPLVALWPVLAVRFTAATTAAATFAAAATATTTSATADAVAAAAANAAAASGVVRVAHLALALQPEARVLLGAGGEAGVRGVGIDAQVAELAVAHHGQRVWVCVCVGGRREWSGNETEWKRTGKREWKQTGTKQKANRKQAESNQKSKLCRKRSNKQKKSNTGSKAKQSKAESKQKVK
jgi:hypothetical protein